MNGFIQKNCLRDTDAMPRWAILLLVTALCAGCFPGRLSPGYFVVTSPVDAGDGRVGDGVCRSTLSGGACTLRAAVEESNATEGENTIRLAAETYTLSLPDRLTITDSLKIEGVNTTATTIDGNRQGFPGGVRRQGVFHVDAAIVWITDLSITKGGGSATPAGGAIRVENAGSVSLARVSLTDSIADTGGGAIYVDGTLIMVDSSVARNEAIGAFCGGIWISGSSTAQIDRTTIEANTSNRCGGIRNHGRLTLTNSTISGNSSTSTGRGTGGLLAVGPTHLNNVTIYNNTSAASGDTDSSGGISVGSANRTTIGNTIVAGNTLGSRAHDCDDELVSTGYNLIQAADDCTISGVSTGNLLGVDAALGALIVPAGGYTRVHPLRPGSSAVGAGHPQVGAGVSPQGRCERTDQRRRIRQLTGAGERCDIGAVEVE